MRLKLLIGAAASVLAYAAVGPCMAQPANVPPQAPVPHFIRTQLLLNAAPAPYQNPDGSYRSYDAFSRDLNGVPCGMNCEARADRAWGYAAPAWPALSPYG